MKAKLREVLWKLACHSRNIISDAEMSHWEKDKRLERVDKALAAIMEMMPRWIPVSKRLPEVDEWVLGSAKPFPLVMRRFNPADGGGWFWQIWSPTGIVSGGNITHWQPLPAAPEAEKEGE